MVSPQRLPAPAIPSLEHWNTDALHILLHASACITICQIGNGAFTELVVEKCAPTEVQGIDPSEGQLKYARARPATRKAEFRQGDAMSLPFPDNSFDLAVMALVIFFVPDPAKGVAEMVRVVSPRRPR